MSGSVLRGYQYSNSSNRHQSDMLTDQMLEPAFCNFKAIQHALWNYSEISHNPKDTVQIYVVFMNIFTILTVKKAAPTTVIFVIDNHATWAAWNMGKNSC